jgi:quercetin dioxygenase-like cupin family protein
MGAFEDLASIAPQAIWDRIAARSLHGDELTLSVVELDPGAVVAEHSHPNEQLGLVLRGSMDFRVADERRQLGPGGSWVIPAGTPHAATAGPDGAVVIDVFAPPRDDWQGLEAEATRSPRWP